MELSLPSLSQGTPAASLASSSGRAAAKQLYDHGGGGRWRRRRMRRAGFGGAAGPLPQVRCGKSSAERNGGGIDASREREGAGGGRFTGPAMEVTTFDRGFGDSEFPIWEKIGAVVRLSYGIGIYGAMALAGRFICSFTGIDCTGGFHPSLDAIVGGLGYAIPPIMALLFILDDEVVKLSPHARAIRDVEDEELWSFFYGMSPWQFILIVAASSIGEELFYRAAIQVLLADVFLRGTDLVTDAKGIASLTGVLPPFVPFAQAFAAVITAALTGSLYYVAASPKDPTYVVAPVLQSRSGRENLKKLFAAWYERRQMKKIYSPLLEGLLALYLGFEWIQTNNILAPIITHGIYSAVILGHGLWKIHDHRRRLRQRIQQLRQGNDSK
ncbi:hypothetical protein EUGRSUZ_D02191 [Eucalyptus grandis]|uniref:CAAX prenyl protease 2/Lysostaphin resistance protein A-like domain-containing protein n=1 Tax=Eucalyptus grandis TaxID=71139 RepID=A0A059CHP1_EUCGR|nr:hypothetical protein EUGRSUZ_D02191 [Eucalyptus grandis]